MKLTISKVPFKGKPVGTEIDMNAAQARLMVKLGRAQYQTRMMTAEAPSFQQAAVLVPDPAPVMTQTDSAGTTWDEKIHASTRLKNSDGTWRKRPGPAKPAEPQT